MTCLTALLLFLHSHQFDDAQLGWVLGDNKTWAYTWITYGNTVHYWAFNHIPSDSHALVKKTGECKLQDGKIVPVLELKRMRSK